MITKCTILQRSALKHTWTKRTQQSPTCRPAGDNLGPAFRKAANCETVIWPNDAIKWNFLAAVIVSKQEAIKKRIWLLLFGSTENFLASALYTAFGILATAEPCYLQELTIKNLSPRIGRRERCPFWKEHDLPFSSYGICRAAHALNVYTTKIFEGYSDFCMAEGMPAWWQHRPHLLRGRHGSIGHGLDLSLIDSCFVHAIYSAHVASYGYLLPICETLLSEAATFHQNVKGHTKWFSGYKQSLLGFEKLSTKIFNVCGIQVETISLRGPQAQLAHLLTGGGHLKVFSWPLRPTKVPYLLWPYMAEQGLPSVSILHEVLHNLTWATTRLRKEAPGYARNVYESVRARWQNKSVEQW